MKVTIAICLSCSFSSFVQFNLLLFFKLGLPLPAVVVWRVHLGHLAALVLARHIRRDIRTADPNAGLNATPRKVLLRRTLALFRARLQCCKFGVENLGLREAHIRLDVAQIIQ
jgi:hypothetical protein